VTAPTLSAPTARFVAPAALGILRAIPAAALAAASVLAFAAHDATAQEPTRLVRQPTVSATHIAFAYANDLWIVDRAGGEATRLTTFQGQETDPHFSPDGRHIAFSAQYDGNFDVYVLPAEGGTPNRLTWHPGPDQVVGWTHDGTRVVFNSGRTSAPIAYPRFFTVALEGGLPEELAIPRGLTGDFSADGARFAYQQRRLNDPEWRGYRGGQVNPVWIVDTDDWALEEVPWDDSNDLDPVWLGDEVFFLSDRDWATNIWAYDTGTRAVRQVTRHADFDVKSLDAGGGAVVYEQAGYIHLLDPASGARNRVDINVRGDFPWLRPHWEDVGGALQNASLSPSGVRALFEARGDIFTVPAGDGDWRNLTRTSGTADRSPAWSPDGRHISWFSDASGEYRLMIGTQDGLEEPREIVIPNPTFFFTPTWSPDSEHLAFTDTDLNLWRVEVASGDVTLVDTDQYAHPIRTVDPVWSPDSRWLAYAKRLDSQFHVVKVHSVADGTTRQLTDGLSDATSPAWDAGGKYLYFLASTDYGLNTGWLDMTSYERPVRRALYLAVLQADEPSPFLPASDEEEAEDAGDEDEGDEGGDSGGGDDSGADSDDIRIDFEGMDQRILAAGIPARDYSGLAAGPEGVVFFAGPGEGGASPTAALTGPGAGTLYRYSLEDDEATPFLTPIQGYSISADGQKLLYRSGPSWGVVDTSGSPSVGDGRIDTAVRMRVDPREEWRQLFREAWRYQRDFLYVENVHGADWDAVRDMYEPWIEHVSHRSDMNYLLDVLAGEVAIGHSYVFGGDNPDVESVPIGLLGADLEEDAGRYRIAHVYTGENWNPGLESPLSAPGIDVAEGDYIISVDGVDLRAPTNPYSLFEGTVGRQVALRVGATPDGEGSRVVHVIPVGNEGALRSREWVEDNRRKVDEMSAGRLAYVWLPNTAQGGYTNFNRYYFAQQDREGAVIDERYNGGGSAADYIVDLMARPLMGFFNNPVEDRTPFRLPGAGIWGPKVMIINDAAGSGGDLLPYMFRFRGIGPLVGTRTWGGLVGVWDVPPLIDGGLVTAPRGGFFDLNGEWRVENEGVAPDIEVRQIPAEVIAGRDPQLEAAIAEAMRLLETEAVEILAEPDPPVRARRPGGM